MEESKRPLRLIERFAFNESRYREIRFLRTSLLGALCALLCQTSLASADQSASNERTDAAVGHYAKARALLVEALEEFESGRKLARPDLLVDPEEWRISVISRAEELNRILDPQPRITRSGTRFQANNRLVKRISKKAAGELPRDSNTYGEAQRTTELRESGSVKNTNGVTKNKKAGSKETKPKAKPDANLMEESELEIDGPQLEIEPNDISKKATADSPDKTASPSKKVEVGSPESPKSKPSKVKSDEPSSKQTKATDTLSTASVKIDEKTSNQSADTRPPAAATVMEDMRREDPSVAGMMEKVIEDRLKKLKEEQAKEAAKPKPSNKTVDGLFEQYTD